MHQDEEVIGPRREREEEGDTEEGGAGLKKGHVRRLGELRYGAQVLFRIE
jgi:hypothetical protein